MLAMWAYVWTPSSRDSFERYGYLDQCPKNDAGFGNLYGRAVKRIFIKGLMSYLRDSAWPPPPITVTESYNILIFAEGEDRAVGLR